MSDRATEPERRTAVMLRTAMGPVINAAMDDPLVIEIMANPDGHLWVERHGTGRADTGQVLDAKDVERVIRLVASHIRQEVTRDNPVVSAELPGGGERFEGVLPPVAINPCFSIRKSAIRIFSLDDYAQSGIMTRKQALSLAEAVTSKKNILIVGGTSSGKTTLANALLQEISDTGDRVVILEDTRELQCEAPDQVCLRTQAGSVSLADLVRSTLRLRPDRIIVGEVRGPEALDLLKAWNTGHPGGIATIHANSARAGLGRVEQLILEATTNVPRALIAEGVDILIFISGRNKARKVEEVLEVCGLEHGEYQLQPYAPSTMRLIPTSNSLSTGDSR